MLDSVWRIAGADLMASAEAKESGGMLILGYMKLQGNREFGWICIRENQKSGLRESICRNDDDIFRLRSPGRALCDGAEVCPFFSGLELELKKGYRQ
jgi:hypothetical protein